MKLARLLHQNRDAYDAFLIVHGTDTMAYTAAALSFMLAGFKKPIVMTGGPSKDFTCDSSELNAFAERHTFSNMD